MEPLQKPLSSKEGMQLLHKSM